METQHVYVTLFLCYCLFSKRATICYWPAVQNTHTKVFYQGYITLKSQLEKVTENSTMFSPNLTGSSEPAEVSQIHLQTLLVLQ